MPLDPNIPLSVKPPQMPSVADTLQQRASIQNMGLEQQLRQQQIEQNQGALSEQKRQDAAKAYLAQAVQANTKIDPKTGQPTTDHAAVATMVAQKFPDFAESYLKTAAANADVLDKFSERDRAHERLKMETLGDLVYRATSPQELTAALALSATHRAIDQADADQLEKEEAAAGANGFTTLKQKYQQFSPEWKKAQDELQKPAIIPEGGIQVAGGQVIARGDAKPKDEWQSFRDAYAQKAGAKDWSTLSPDQQMAGFSAFTLAKQDPAMHELLKDNAAIRNSMMQMQLGQQPTQDDAKLFANEMLAHKLAPSQIQLFGGFGGQGAMFKRMVGAEALRQDPNFDWEQAEADYQFSKSSGFQSTTRFMQSVTESMPRLLDNAKKLGNTTMQSVNALINKGKTEFNGVDLKKFNTDRLLVGDEVTKILQGGGTGSSTSDAKLKQATAILSENDSVPAIAGAMEEINALIGYRQKALTRGTYLDRPAAETPKAADLPKGLPTGASIQRH